MPSRPRAFFAGLLLFLAGTGAAAAQPSASRDAPPVAFTRAVQCRAIATPQERLACYDREVAALEAAEAANDIRIVDRQQIRTTRRSLFGIPLPNLNSILGGGNDPEMTEIEATIRSASRDPSGKWTFVLEDGARWAQIDSREINDPRGGQPIRIRRGAMGSFMANVNRQTAIRVRRVQ